ncbi:MAG: hypothetical protein JO027_07660 [Solirubrobacterales bacterium]|nr:hypothetical protein [Solirubrobacterales bacterium]
MKRLVTLCALLGTLALSATASAATVHGQVSGTLLGVFGRTFAIQAAGSRMPVVQALAAAADSVTAGDYPYVYGGGHADAGVASIGIKGPGYNGRRIGFDCSGSVAAVLSQAGLWPVAAGVPNDAGVIAQLLAEHLIARGRGHGANEVTFYDDAGVHIFMDIDGRFFGTSDGGGGGNPNGGAGWLDDGAPDASSRTYKPYHLLAGVVERQTTLARVFTFQTAGHPALTHGLELGSVVHVAYTVTPDGRAVAQRVG